MILRSSQMAAPGSYLCFELSLTYSSCLCLSFMEDFAISPGWNAAGMVSLPTKSSSTAGLVSNVPKEVEMNPDFSFYIPRFIDPKEPCDYCRSHQLHCFTFDCQESCCSPCKALFRRCSWTNVTTEPKKRGLMDTLHLVPENSSLERGSLTGVKTMRSILVSLER